jgi:formylglycine-generating enzyme required for sulfatase activity
MKAPASIRGTVPVARTDGSFRSLRPPRGWVVLFAAGLLFTACGSENGADPKNPPSTNLEMITIPGGSFRMGDITGGSGQPAELPVHQVTLRAFMVARYETTADLYLRVTGISPGYHTGNPDYPVENVSWYEAISFCNALSAREKLRPAYGGTPETGITCDFSANGYRLPTEAEWEFACRAGSETDYCSGNGTAALESVGWYLGNAGNNTHAAGELNGNGYSLADMHGNIAEWCWDWFSPSAYSATPADNPGGPASGTERVRRGGGYLSNATSARSAARSSATPEIKTRDTGFRVVRSVI